MLKHGAVILTRALMLFMLLALAPLSNAMAQNAYELRQSWQTISELLAAQGRQTEAEQISASIRALSDQDLERIYQQSTLDDMISTLKDIQQAVNVVDSLNSNLSVQKYMDNRAAFQASPQMDAQAKPAVVGAFPDDLNYPNADYCPYSPERSRCTGVANCGRCDSGRTNCSGIGESHLVGTLKSVQSNRGRCRGRWQHLPCMYSC